MWKSIKRVFKWIADYTGISWIARKISSGWKWLFGGKAKQNTSQQEGPSGNERHEPAQANDQSKTTTPKTLDNKVNPDQLTPPKQPASSNKPNFVQQNTKPGSYLEATDNKLLFITTNENYKVLEEKCKNEDQEGKVIPGEFRVFIKCDGENFCITGSYDSQQDVSGGKKSVSITSIRKQKAQSLVSSNPSEMIYQVGLDENRKLVEITRISRKPFKTATLEQPNPNVTSHNVTQQTVNNDSNKEVTAEEHASGSTITDQAPGQPAFGSEVASPSGTTADYNEPKSERIEISGEKLGLVVNADKEDFMQASKNPSNSEEYLVYIEHAKGTLKITGPNLQCVNAGNENELQYFAINSVASQDGKTVSGELAEMKKMLGLDENKKFIEITRISGTLNQSNTNAIGATQQVVNNEEVTTEPEEWFDVEDGGVTQPKSLTTDPAVEQSTPVSSSKAPINGTLPKVASPSETKNGSNNGAVVLYQMPHDERRLRISPELENFLSSKSLVREMLFCKVVPNSLLVQTREEPAAGNDHSH